MASTGARGSTLNIGQMTAALGQQSIRGKRIIKDTGIGLWPILSLVNKP